MMSDRTADICLVGMGVAGGILAKELGSAGLDVVALERGSSLAREDYEARDSIKFTTRSRYLDWMRNEPVSFRNSSEKPAALRYNTTSAVGGRMLTWTGQSARFSRDVFQVFTQDIASGDAERAGADLTGYEIQDWPVSYDELEPYYEKFEWDFGVSGGGTPNVFGAPRKKGYPLPPLRRSAKMELFEAACQKLGYHPYQSAAGILSQSYRPPAPYDSRIEERAGCVYCGHCNHYGCHVHAKAAPSYTVVPVALQTGHVDLRPDCKVFRINSNERGEATGVQYFGPDGSIHEQRARVVILCGFVFENVRLLLLSGREGSRGMANASGRVGHGLCGHGDVRTIGIFDDHIINRFIGPNSASIRMDDFNGSNFDHTGLGFIRGAALGTSGDGAPVQTYNNIPPDVPRWGRDYKEFLKRYYTRNFEINSATETLPHRENLIDLDPEHKDRWGIPVPRVTFSFHQNEVALQKFIAPIQQKIMRTAGASRLWTKMPRSGNRWTGGTCMGRDSSSSVVDGNCQAHDVPNLFVLGASCFTTLSGYPATATIGALAYRAADHIKSQKQWFS